VDGYALGIRGSLADDSGTSNGVICSPKLLLSVFEVKINDLVDYRLVVCCGFYPVLATDRQLVTEVLYIDRISLDMKNYIRVGKEKGSDWFCLYPIVALVCR
jgi:hypothetical protein